jgi:hypothetical protein
MLNVRSCVPSLVASTFFLCGCNQSTAQDFVGDWELWSIDDVPTAEAPPEVFELPPFSSGEVTFSPGELRTESRTLHRMLEILPDGEYLDVHAQEQTLVASPRAVRAFGGVAFGTDPVREVQPTDTSRVLGEWTLEEDTLRLTLDRD